MTQLKIIWNSLREQLLVILKLFTPGGRRDLELDDINDKLAKAVIDQEKEKARLKRRIYRHFNRQFGFRSKYIRKHGKSEHHIRMECEHLFGEDMRNVNLKLTHDLRLQ